MSNTQQTRPWYKHPWPWFFISVPIGTIMAGAVTAYLAGMAPDPVVSDDYYQEGLAINRDLARDAKALQLGLQARIELTGGQQLRVELLGNHANTHESIHLRLLHPTLDRLDQDLELQRTADGRYQTKLEAMPAGDRYVVLSPPDRLWRLTGRITLPLTRAVLP